MATPQFNIKTGADSSSFFSREITRSDENESGEKYSETELGLIRKEKFEDVDYYSYPVLVRRTGDSLKGTTESIESNELRKGRTKSAPRKGSSSSEGSLDFEFSPETYDDILEAVFRNEWKAWKNDTNSASNLNGDYGTFKDGYFSMKSINSDGDVVDVEKRLYGTQTEYDTIQAAIEDGTKTEADLPLIITSDADNLEVAELTCGETDIRYDVLKQYGGVEGDDLYQDYQHLSVNTLDMSVTPGQIVTGSFGFMGSNNPELVQTGLTTDGKYILKDETKSETAPTTLDKATGIIKVLADRFLAYKDKDVATRCAAAKNFIDTLPEKGTSSDQYTAREGFLYIDGMRVQYGSNLSFNLNNGLERTFAIFEKDAIAMSPLSLDITGSLGAYLIKDYSEKLYNLAIGDKDVEVLFCFQDKEENPNELYVVQIFKTKFTDTDISSGAENLEVTFPFQSFEERAIRIFRIRRKQPIYISELTDGTTTFKVQLSTALADTTVPTGTTVKIAVGEADAVATTVTVESTALDELVCALPSGTEVATGDSVQITVEYNGVTKSKVYTVAAA